MGNLFSNTDYSLAELDELKSTIGKSNHPIFDSEYHPSPLNGLFTENSLLTVLMDKVKIVNDDKELLNRFLVEIHNHLKTNYNEKISFKDNVESAELVLSNINGITDFTEDHLSVLDTITDKKNELEKIKNINTVSCVYKFPEDTVFMYDRVQSVSLDKVKVGVKSGNFTLYSPDTSPEETDHIKIHWWIYELDGGEVYVIPTSIEGVRFENNRVIEYSEIHLQLLEEASEFMKEKNDRSMKSKLDQYKKWQDEIKKTGKVYAIVGGSQIGDMDYLTDFFEKIQLV